jgi:hypothetical protein
MAFGTAVCGLTTPAGRFAGVGDQAPVGLAFGCENEGKMA